MESLSGLDAVFLNLESPTTHLHVGLAAIFEGSDRVDGTPLDRVLRLVGSRLHLMPPFRRKLVASAGGLRPFRWVDDDSFRLEDHVVALPPLARVTPETVAGVAADVIRRPLDRRKPLWEMYVLEGELDGRMAIVAKVHHAAVDGVSGVSLLSHLVDFVPDAEPSAASPVAESTPPESARPETSDSEPDAERPDAFPRGVSALWEWFDELAAEYVSDLTKLTDALVWRRERRTERAQSAPEESTRTRITLAPRTSLTQLLSDRRSVAFATVPMDDLARVKKSLGGTVNDVVLAICSGALRNYLLDRGDALEESLIAGVPVSLRDGSEAQPGGNLVSAMLIPLATDVADARGRYRAIVARTTAAKRSDPGTNSAKVVSDLLSVVRPVVLRQAGRLVSRAAKAGVIATPCNVAISNIPGPPCVMYAMGMELAAVYPLGPIVDGVPLNITVLSYCDDLHIGLVACPYAMPDVAEFPARMRDALDELLACCH